jgi:hypothetical protein
MRYHIWYVWICVSPFGNQESTFYFGFRVLFLVLYRTEFMTS